MAPAKSKKRGTGSLAKTIAPRLRPARAAARRAQLVELAEAAEEAGIGGRLKNLFDKHGGLADFVASVLDYSPFLRGLILAEPGRLIALLQQEPSAALGRCLAATREAWRLDDKARTDLLAALSYFVDPDDLIPDTQPRYGLLDDALVIDIAIRAQHHEWLAWQEFDRFRRDLRARGDFRPLDRQLWMDARRELLEAGMHRRPSPRYDAALSADRFHRERHSYVSGNGGDTAFGVH